jgi:anti-sigma factor RsiW
MAVSDPSPLSPEDEADLVAFADGRLDPERRAALQSRLDADPELAAALERQRAGLAAIATAVESTSAPLALRARVEELERGQQPRTRRARLPRIRFGGLGLAAATAAAAVLAVFALGGGPGVSDVVAAATRPPVAAVSPAQGPLLTERVEDVHFPNYLAKFGWKAVGTRTDEIEGRQTRTVFYEKGGRRIAYTIVAGEALPEPEDAPRDYVDGVLVRSLEERGYTVVTWERLGNTCVLASKDVPANELKELAAWKGKGAVRF